jgi:hypothetical protein
LAATPPSKRRFAVVCAQPDCGFARYFFSDWEVWESSAQHKHANATHVFHYGFAGEKQRSGFTLYKYRWNEILEFRDDLRATS